MTWVGIDVGGRRKGFHLAALASDGRWELARGATPVEAASWAACRRPSCVAVDSPAEWAPPGQASRRCEREFARAGICGIRFTPDAARGQGRAYYEWVEHGLELWEELSRRGLTVVECFPTASWTQWCGPRVGSRAAWTRSGQDVLFPGGAAPARNQDERDAVAAALTARQAVRGAGSMLHFGQLVVPRAGPVG